MSADRTESSGTNEVLEKAVIKPEVLVEGGQGLVEDFGPVAIRGESISDTILRERR
jgi:hypothetical protein